MDSFKVEGALVLVRNEDANWDWWTIERKEHPNKHYVERTDYGTALRYTGRISDADVEGNSEEMMGMADGILNKKGYQANRCAVGIEGESVFFCSPRNSQTRGEVPLKVAEALANQIVAEMRL